MLAQLEKIDGVVLSARWPTLGAAPVSDDVITGARTFLETVDAAVKQKDGKIRYLLPDQVTALFPIQGRVADTELKAVEAARRILIDVRRYNAKTPAVPMQVVIALTGGAIVLAPGAANLDSMMLGEPVSTLERLLRAGRSDAVVVSEPTYGRISFVYKGRAVEGQPSKMFELVL
jgi:class 3 adenylate cyclase